MSYQIIETIHLVSDDGLINEGQDCWWKCCKQNGPCNWCGTGLCCKKGVIKNGCDGTFGGGSTHQCSLPDPGW